MSATHPFGDPQSASIFVIGHDPRLQNSRTEAETAFFLDYLLRPRPTRAGEARKYGLANALVDYVSDLAGQQVALDSLYVTNLCNVFLPPTQGRGTVLIPDELAAQGAAEIAAALAQGRFQVIIPLSLQVAYHLARLRFFDEDDEHLRDFVHQARPAPAKARQGVYHPAGPAPFVNFCGRRLHHQAVPVVPVLHVKQWPLRPLMTRYVEPMTRAAQEIRQVMSRPMP